MYVLRDACYDELVNGSINRFVVAALSCARNCHRRVVTARHRCGEGPHIVRTVRRLSRFHVTLMGGVGGVYHPCGGRIAEVLSALLLEACGAHARICAIYESMTHLFADPQKELALLRRRLSSIVNRGAVESWLDGPHPGLKGETPRDAVLAGHAAQVHLLIDRASVPCVP